MFILSFPKGSVTGYDSSLGGGWMIFFLQVDCSSPFCFLLIEFHCVFFSISYKGLTCYVYYYYILLGCEMDVVHRMNEGYRAWGALKSVLSNRGLGIKAKKCLYE